MAPEWERTITETFKLPDIKHKDQIGLGAVNWTKWRSATHQCFHGVWKVALIVYVDFRLDRMVVLVWSIEIILPIWNQTWYQTHRLFERTYVNLPNRKDRHPGDDQTEEDQCLPPNKTEGIFLRSNRTTLEYSRACWGASATGHLAIWSLGREGRRWAIFWL